MKKRFPLLFFIFFTVLLACGAVFVALTPGYYLEHIGGDVLPVALVYALPGLCALVSLYLAKWFSRSKVFALDGLSVGVDLLVLACIAGFALVFLFTAAHGEIRYLFMLPGALRLAAVGVIAAWFCLVAAKDAALKLKAPAEGDAEWSFPSNFTVWTLLLASVYALIGLVTVRHGLSDRIQFHTLFFLVVFWFMAVGTALCATLARRMWSRSKAVALTLAGVFAGMLLLANFVYLAMDSESYYGYRGADIDRMLYEAECYSEPDWDEGDYVGDDESEEEEEPEGLAQPRSLDFLWHDSDDDIDSVSAALSYVAREVEMSGFPNNSPYPRFEMLAYMSYYSQDLRPEGPGSVAYTKIIKYLHKKISHYTLNAIYRNYAPLVNQFIPYSTYRERGYERIVEALIAAYRDLEGTDGFFEIARIMGHEGQDYSEYYAQIKPWTTKSTLRKMRDGDGDLDIEFAVWAYSFWGRRYNEDSIGEVFETLTGIRDSYVE